MRPGDHIDQIDSERTAPVTFPVSSEPVSSESVSVAPRPAACGTGGGVVADGFSGGFADGWAAVASEPVSARLRGSEDAVLISRVWVDVQKAEFGSQGGAGARFSDGQGGCSGEGVEIDLRAWRSA